MAADPFYRQCCITGRRDEKIEFHHNLEFKGSQFNAKWAILPLAKSVHDNIVTYKEVCDWIMLNRATVAELAEVSKAIDYVAVRNRLNVKYGRPCRIIK